MQGLSSGLCTAVSALAYLSRRTDTQTRPWQQLGAGTQIKCEISDHVGDVAWCEIMLDSLYCYSYRVRCNGICSVSRCHA